MTITIADLRVLLSDPTGADEKLSDAEYQIILNIAGADNPYTACYITALTLSAAYADLSKTDVGPLSFDYGKEVDRYNSIADRYKKLMDMSGESINNSSANTIGSPIVHGITASEIIDNINDNTIYKAAFVRGLMNNPNYLYDAFRRDDLG